mgnify:FL=1
MRVVLDTNVLISATLWSGSVAQKLLFKLIHADAQIFSSVEILEEYRRVLQRDFEYAENEVAYILGKIVSFMTLISSKEKVDIVKEDPDDNKIIECALASASMCIATYDKHLLNLKEVRGIKIVKPEELL